MRVALTILLSTLALTGCGGSDESPTVEAAKRSAARAEQVADRIEQICIKAARAAGSEDALVAAWDDDFAAHDCWEIYAQKGMPQ